jgi:asparagine synthase (glutamine-hydrolysing)
MSRLAGVVGAPEGRPRVDRMLAVSAGASTIATAADAAIGWRGAGAANVAEEAGVIVVCDGDVYNAEELGLGGTAAASLLALYRAHGIEGALARVNGDFAFALHDPASRALWLARDRFGVKPLYYATTPDGLAFASRPRALLQVPGVSRRYNRRFVALFAGSHYRTFDNAPHESPYADIAQLPAAHLLEWRDGRVGTRAYWTLEAEEDLREPEPLLAERCRALLLDAVRLRRRGRARPAFTLSGGMDSS